MKAVIQNIGGCRFADFDIPEKSGVVVLRGLNEIGKSSILRALHVLTSRDPNPYGVTATQAAAIYRRIGSEHSEARLSGDNWTLTWNGAGAVKVNGFAPAAVPSKIFSGSLVELKGKTAAVGWQEVLQAEVLREHLEARLTEAALELDEPQRERVVGEIVEFVFADPDALNWKDPLDSAEFRSRQAKRKWSATVAEAGERETWGSKKGGVWRPKFADGSCEGLTVTAAAKAATDLLSRLEAARRTVFISEEADKRRRELQARLADQENAVAVALSDWKERKKERTWIDGQRSKAIEHNARRKGQISASDAARDRLESLRPELEEAKARVRDTQVDIEAAETRVKDSRASWTVRQRERITEKADHFDKAQAARQWKRRSDAQKKAGEILPGLRAELKRRRKIIRERAEHLKHVFACPHCRGLFRPSKVNGETKLNPVKVPDAPATEQLEKQIQTQEAILEVNLGPEPPTPAPFPEEREEESYKRLDGELETLRRLKIQLREQNPSRVEAAISDAEKIAETSIPEALPVMDAPPDLDAEPSWIAWNEGKSAVDATKKELARFPENATVGDSGELDRLETDSNRAQTRLKAVELIEKSRRYHAEALLWEGIARVLKPQGIRSEAVASKVKYFNSICETLSARAGKPWTKTELDRKTWRLKLDGRDILICSGSEKWRAAATAAITLAVMRKARICLLDDMETLVGVKELGDTRRGFMKVAHRLANAGGIPLVVAIAAPHTDRAATLDEFGPAIVVDLPQSK